ncbi:jg1112 [Pararge aegeria aegeria]|uniref:Jg1112 protein n=1 Tax=Pararge aegeria aegeria TaxID=348720 RepID=A0A8S4QRH4_9NEOP|nr:jg1112 [Pararge aegeria aegeria]
MANVGPKTKSDVNMEHSPVKKVKMETEVDDSAKTRSVATMCGAWRPDEVDGGLIFVFKERVACLSPDPTMECDFPENIEDFWEASLVNVDIIKFQKGPQYPLNKAFTDC